MSGKPCTCCIDLPQVEAHSRQLEADLAARSHEAVDARGRAEFAEGLLRRLVADVVYVHDGTVSDCTGIKAIFLDPAEAAQLDRIINTKESE